VTIPEAVQLVLQAAVLGVGGEVFALDMGEPVCIADLAGDLIRLSGFEPGRDIDIVFTGLRPGEKLYGELFADREAYTRTRHEKIFVCSNGAGPGRPPGEFEAAVDALVRATHRGEAGQVRQLLGELVPEYRPGERGEDERMRR